MTRPIDFVTELPNWEIVSFCWCNLVSKMVIKCAAIRTRKKAVQMFEEFYFSREPRLQSRLQARQDELDKQEFLRVLSAVSSELRPDTYVFCLTTSTKNVISRVLGL